MLTENEKEILPDLLALAKILDPLATKQFKISEPNSATAADEDVQLLAQVKKIIFEKKRLLHFLKKINPSGSEGSIARDFSIDAAGNISGKLNTILPNHEFDPSLERTINKPTLGLAKCIQIALITTISGSRKKPQKEESSNDEYLTAFGARNLSQYSNLNILKPVHHVFAANQEKYKNEFESPKFFHNFLLNFNRIRREFNAALDQGASNEVHRAYNDRIINLDQHLASPLLVSGALGLLAAECNGEPAPSSNHFAADENGEHLIGNKIIKYASTIGISSTRDQEDGAIAGEGVNETPISLQRKFQQIAEKVNNNPARFEQGSTAIIANYSTDQILTVGNCGDSKAVLFLVHPDKNVKFISMSNNHSPSDPLERARLNAAGCPIINLAQSANSSATTTPKDDYRMWDPKRKKALSVSSGFGDKLYNTTNIDAVNTEPDIAVENIAQILNKNVGSRIFLLVSCDGLYTPSEHNNKNLSEENYAKALSQWFKEEAKHDQHNIAVYLQNHALLLGSTDNVTLLFTELTQAPTKPLTLGVFDGHGGAEISRSLVEYFSEVFLQEEKRLQILPHIPVKETSTTVDKRKFEPEPDSPSNSTKATCTEQTSQQPTENSRH